MLKEKSIFKFEFIITIFIIILGVILHFTYEWSGENIFVGIFSPVNESIWEHLKLFYFPMSMSMILGYLYDGKNYSNYISIKILGIIISMIFTVIAFYTYSGIIGKSIDSINIALFFISVILGQYIVIKNINNNKTNTKLSIKIWILIGILFVIFTFNPLYIGIFKDPRTGLFGI